MFQVLLQEENEGGGIVYTTGGIAPGETVDEAVGNVVAWRRKYRVPEGEVVPFAVVSVVRGELV